MATEKNTAKPEETEKATQEKKSTVAIKPTPVEKECKHYVYVGPSLPGGQLKSNTVLQGTKEEIKKYYKDVLGKYPQAEKLIVPISKLGESKEKVQKPGNIIHKYFNDVVSEIGKDKEE